MWYHMQGNTKNNGQPTIIWEVNVVNSKIIVSHWHYNASTFLTILGSGNGLVQVIFFTETRASSQYKDRLFQVWGFLC